MLPKRLREAAGFARFCMNYAHEPAQVAELINAADIAARAGERECNHPNAKPADRLRRRVERLALQLGYTTDWPGLYPSFTDARGFTVHFPTL